IIISGYHDTLNPLKQTCFPKLKPSYPITLSQNPFTMSAQLAAGPIDVSHAIFVPMTSGSSLHLMVSNGDETLYTYGISSCSVIAAYTPNNRRRALCHVNGGAINTAFVRQLAGFIQNGGGRATVIIANGTIANPNGLEREATALRDALSHQGIQLGHGVEVVECWTDPEQRSTPSPAVDAGMFAIQAGGSYGRCDPRTHSDGLSSTHSRKKRWYFCWCC
ncbi:hypothetical protein B0H66DRAFT_615382, partial [Apodospora peruviana]